MQQPPPLFPTNPQWHDYSAAWNGGQMSKYMATSAIMTAIIVVGQLVTSILAAYAFAFLRFPFKRTLFVICLATLMIPLEVTFITNLDTITSLHWFNTYEGLSIPFLATGFGIFLLRQAFLQIPRDLQEAAQLDGYGHLRFMTRVAVPLARPSLAALAVFSFLGGLEPVPVAAGVDRRDDAARHGADRAEAAPRHPGVADPRVARRRRHRLRAAGDPPAHLPEAARAQPHRRRGQVSGADRAARRPARVLGNSRMRTPRLPRLAAAALVVTSATAATGLGRRRSAGAAPAGAASLPSCNLKALANHKGVVDITFWESASEANLTTLQSITNAFNSSQSKVHVTLVTQAGYDDTWQKYLAGLTNGQLPDAVQLEDQRTQAAIDTGSFLPVQSCMNAAKYSTSDYLPRPLAYWKVNGVQWALPFAVSAPILYYNQNAFTKAGLNPADPPTTLPADGDRRQDAQGLGQRHGPRARPLAPRDLAGHGQPALREQQERAQRTGHRGRVRHQDRRLHLQPARPARALGRRHHQPVDGSRRVRQPARASGAASTA